MLKLHLGVMRKRVLEALAFLRIVAREGLLPGGGVAESLNVNDGLWKNEVFEVLGPFASEIKIEVCSVITRLEKEPQAVGAGPFHPASRRQMCR